MKNILFASMLALFANALHAETLWTCSAYCASINPDPNNFHLGWAQINKSSKQVLAQGSSAKEAFENLIKTCDPEGNQKFMLVDTIQFQVTPNPSVSTKQSYGPANPIKMTQACIREQ